MEPARLSYIGGNLVLAGPRIDAIARASKEHIPVCSHLSHPLRVTVVSDEEFRVSSKKFDESLWSDDSDSIVALGVGCQDEIYFSAIFWKAGIELRRDLGLPFKQLHIPLTGTAENVIPGLDVNLTSVIECSNSNFVRDHKISAVIDYCKFLAQDPSLANKTATEMVAVLRQLSSVPRFRNADAALLDLLAVVLYKATDADGCLTVSKELMLLFPNDPRGYFRCASCYFHMNNHSGFRSSSSSLGKRHDAAPPPAYCWKLAMMLYAEAVKHALKAENLQHHLIQQPPGFAEKLIRQACQAILDCAKHTEFGCLMTSAEAEVFPDEYLHLTLPWNPEVRNAVLQAFIARGEPAALEQLLSLESRERLCVYDHESKQVLRLPRFFRWITPFRVAAMSTPKTAADIRLLTKLGVGTVVTLTKEEELNPGWFTTAAAAASQPRTINVFLPVANYKAPSIAQVDYFFSLVDDAQSGRTNLAMMVHCGGGKGRAGTFVACYLARYGFAGMAEMNPKYSGVDVVKTVRHMRPGSIETVEQEQFIAGFVKELWKRAHTGGKLVLLPEPESQDGTDDFLIEGIFNAKCKMLVCCGIPGSGKSTISKCLARAGWTVASQDETGSRDACAAVVYSAMRLSKSVVVDRCNPTIRDRKGWIDLAMLSPNEVSCIFFDYDEDLCLQRAKLRLDHPTLTSDSRCTYAVRSMSKSLERPSMSEGFGAIVIIRSIAAANKLVLYYAGTPKSVDSKDSCSSSSSWRTTSDPELRLSEFHKFPHTRHLLNFGSATRDDLIMTRAEAVSFLSSSTGGGREGEEVVITFEEKVDGANLGFSIDPETGHIRAQNRSHFVTSKSHSQFKKLDFWIDTHREGLTNLLCPPRADKDGKHSEQAGPYILFGEWLQATHSIRYTRLPDYFMAFDMYNVAEQKFWSRERFWAALKGTSIIVVPQISALSEDMMHEGFFKELMGRLSAFYDGAIEGVYVRRDRGSFLADRGKVVRSDFISGNAHWTKQAVVSENTVTRSLSPVFCNR